MRFFSLMLLVALCSTAAWAEPLEKPIKPEEAAKKVNEKVTVEMEVKSAGGKENIYLNTEADYKDAKNFEVFIPKESLEKFKKAKIEDPKMHYNGNLIQVTGTVSLNKEKPRIKVEEPEQIKVIEKKK